MVRLLKILWARIKCWGYIYRQNLIFKFPQEVVCYGHDNKICLIFTIDRTRSPCPPKIFYQR